MKKIFCVSSLIVAMTGCAAAETGSESAGGQAEALRAPDHGVTFEDASALLAPFSRAASGEGLGGIAWLDYDNDGHLDLYLTNGVGAANGLFKNNGNGSFTDVTVAAGVSNGWGNSGVVTADIDNDGWTDIFLTGEGHLVGPGQTPNRLYHNQGNGTFAQIAAPAHPGSALGATFGDINGDGFVDLFVASPGHIPFLTGPGTGESHPNKLYLNNGDLTFTDISASAGIEGLYPNPWNPAELTSDGACVSGFTDYDQDGDVDILVGNCNAYPPAGPPVRPTPFNLFRNNGDNTFTDVADAAGLATAPGGFWMGLAFGDYDNDSDIDFFATSTGTLNGLLHVLMRNNGDGTFTDVGATEGVAASEFGWGATMADFDNDGDLDLYQVGSLPLFGAIGPGVGSPGRLFFNDGASGFVDSTPATGVNLSFHYTSGVVQGDFDGDGFADIVVMTAPWEVRDPSTGAVIVANPDGRPVLLRNEGNGNRSLTLRLVGTNSNRGAIGARVEVTVARATQLRELRAGSSMASTDSPWPSFGLGHRDSADVRITWPSGLVEEFDNVTAGGVVTLTEGTGDTDAD